jgi:hypothetical protein
MRSKLDFELLGRTRPSNQRLHQEIYLGKDILLETLP